MVTTDLTPAQRKALTEIARTGRAGATKDATLRALIRRELIDTTDPVDLKLTEAGRERVACFVDLPPVDPEPVVLEEHTAPAEVVAAVSGLADVLEAADDEADQLTSIRVSALLRPHVAAKLDGPLAAKITTATPARDESVRIKATGDELATLQDFAQDVGQSVKDGPTVRSAVALAKWIDRLRG